MTQKKRERIPQGVRFDVFRRDNFTCVYCGASSPAVTLECDHRVAVANGGGDDPSNLVTACWDCNRGKGTKSVKPISRKDIRSDNDNPSGLIGVFGHTRDDDGKINWQFEIVGKAGSDTYTVQLFSWMDGRATNIKIMTVEFLTSEKCTLYASRDEWIWQWARESAREDGRGEKWARGTFYMATGRQYGDAA